MALSPADRNQEDSMNNKLIIAAAVIYAGAVSLAHAEDLRLKPLDPGIQLSRCLDDAKAEDNYTLSFANRAENLDDYLSHANKVYRNEIQECWHTLEVAKARMRIYPAPPLSDDPIVHKNLTPTHPEKPASIGFAQVPSYDEVIASRRHNQ
jgi:hypothetical protein